MYLPLQILKYKVEQNIGDGKMTLNSDYISGVITDGFALCEDLRYYLQKSIKEELVTLRVSQAANRVFIDSPLFKSIDAHYVCLSWDDKTKRIVFNWRNDKGEIKVFESLLEVAEDIERSIRQ